DFNAQAWDTQRTDDQNIAIPLDTHPFTLFYNKEVCERAGLLDDDGLLVDLTGMDRFQEALKELSAVTGGIAITVANVAETATPWRFFWTLYNQLDGATPFLSDDGATISVDESLFLEVMGTVQDWVEQGWLNSALDYATSQTQMFTGKAGFYLQGEWEIATAQSIEGLDFGMAPIPQLFDRLAVQADSHTFILPRKQRSPAQRQQAMEFIRTMLEQSLIWAEGGHVPAYLPRPRARSTSPWNPSGTTRAPRTTPSTTTPPGTAAPARRSRTPWGRSWGSSSRVRSPPSRRWPRSGTSSPPTPRPPARSHPEGTAHDHDVSPRAAGRTGAGHTLPSGRRDDPPHPSGLAVPRPVRRDLPGLHRRAHALAVRGELLQHRDRPLRAGLVRGPGQLHGDVRPGRLLVLAVAHAPVHPLHRAAAGGAVLRAGRAHQPHVARAVVLPPGVLPAVHPALGDDLPDLGLHLHPDLRAVVAAGDAGGHGPGRRDPL